jgi:hypothetical protein
LATRLDELAKGCEHVPYSSEIESAIDMTDWPVLIAVLAHVKASIGSHMAAAARRTLASVRFQNIELYHVAHMDPTQGTF